MNAFCVVSDRGTLTEESSFYSKRPLAIRSRLYALERVQNDLKRLKKGFVLSGIDTVGLHQSVDLAVEMVQNGDVGIPVPNYIDTNVSDKVVRIIQFYGGVVNIIVWRKP